LKKRNASRGPDVSHVEFVMEVVVEKLGDSFGPWNVLGSHVALKHRRALGIGGLA